MNEIIQWQTKPRLGLINYVNCLPVLLPIANGLIDLKVELVLGQPSRLNSLFADGKLEYGAMSAFFFLEQSNSFELIPAISISSQNAVTSVLLFSKNSIAEYPPKNICVPAGSATSINAMLLMLSHFSKHKPQIITVENPVFKEGDFDAVLVIGDRALIVDEAWSKKYHRYDIGEWWHLTYDLPMVFGVFAARNDWLRANESNKNKQSLIEQLGEGLANAAGLGLGCYFDSVLDEAVVKTGLSRSRLERYYKRDLDFSWTAKHQQALNKYELLCRQNGLFQDKKVLA